MPSQIDGGRDARPGYVLPNPGQDGAERGFTLLEVIVVLAIVGAVLALVPLTNTALDGLRLRTAAARVAEVLRGLRIDAMRAGASTAVIIDADGRNWRWSGTPGIQALPSIVDSVYFTRVGMSRPEHSIVFNFFPDGSATGGEIVLCHGQQKEIVDIDWLTGRISDGD